jgi:outer membrane protein OmpA-like peptidoglycan-associated protein
MLLTVLSLLANPAAAQDAPEGGLNAHGFDLVAHDGDPRDLMTVVRPGTFHEGDYFVTGLFEYVKSPLVVVVEAQRTGETLAEEALLDNVYGAVLSGGYAPHDYVRLDVQAPLFFSSEGIDGAQQGVDMGDVRGAVTVAILRPDHLESGGGFGLGVHGHVDVPSGRTKHFLGRGEVAGGGRVAATYESGPFTATGNLGAQFTKAVDIANFEGADQMILGGGLGFRPHHMIGFNIEASGLPPLDTNARKGTAFPAEVMGSIRFKAPNHAHISVGAGTSLGTGIGAAEQRIVVGGGYGKVQPFAPPDFDTEAMFEVIDGCPDELETPNGFRDDDGCPDQLGDLLVRVEYMGAPVQGAAVRLTGPDGSADHTTTSAPITETAVPGSQWSATATAPGCLEGDGSLTAGEGANELVVKLNPIYDARVIFEVTDMADEPLDEVVVQWRSDSPTCIQHPEVTIPTGGRGYQDVGHGSHRIFFTAPGYQMHEELLELDQAEERTLRIRLKKTRVRVEKKRIVILDKVHFETNKAVIKPDSFDLLSEVAAIIMANTHVGRVEVAGHTDSDGSNKYNLDLSQRRAEAVQTFLADRGVDAARLVAKGYGEEVPIAANTTDEGKARNRRVEFNLIDQEEEPELEESP